MASEVAGLDPLHGYFKHGNLVLRMRFRISSERPRWRSSSSASRSSERLPDRNRSQRSRLVAVQDAPVIEVATPSRKPPMPAVEQQVKPSAKATEQQHFFE